jgi:hypothetical protein
VVLTLSVVPGVFTVDENHHLVSVLGLRHGHVTVSNTAGLTPSRELLFFDPAPLTRNVTSTPVGPTVPPLYAFIALPFFWFGWRGLVGLNTLAYLATIAMVFTYTRRYAVQRSTSWLAALTFAFCGFSIEYAIGLWPQSLSVALCLAAIVLAGDVIESNIPASAAMAGLLLGLATGVRYQNAAVLVTVGGAIFLWARRRVVISLLYWSLAVVPIAISAIINHERLKSWNPVSKGPGYLNLPVAQDAKSSWLDPLTMFWARVCDYSFRPHLMSHTFEGWVTYDPVTGAHLVFGFAVKKALLQSSPWAVIGLLAMALACVAPRTGVNAKQRQMRLLSLVTFVLLATFAFSGIWRDDGLSFNQRYLLEIVPLIAIAFAWTLDSFALQPLAICSGAGIGVLVVLGILTTTPLVGQAGTLIWTLRLYALLKVPLFLAAILAWSWFFASFRPRRRSLLALSTGVCLGWAVTLHLAYDVPLAQGRRRYHLERTQALSMALPDNSALIAYWGMKEPAGPLLMDRDLVVLDPRTDDGVDAGTLIRELLKQKRRVFVLDESLPQSIRERVIGDFRTVAVDNARVNVLELR